MNVNSGSQRADLGNMTDAPPSAAPKKAKKKQAWLVVVLVLLLSAAGLYIWHGTKGPSAASEDRAESTLALETFTVNLASNHNGSRQHPYLRIGITLGLAPPSSAPDQTRKQREVAPIALIRDTVLSVLATARPENLLELEGKSQLKSALLKTLQEKVPQMAVRNVYFTEFLIQM
jgi:flagellar basal body-associated protein FliL